MKWGTLLIPSSHVCSDSSPSLNNVFLNSFQSCQLCCLVLLSRSEWSWSLPILSGFYCETLEGFTLKGLLFNCYLFSFPMLYCFFLMNICLYENTFQWTRMKCLLDKSSCDIRQLEIKPMKAPKVALQDVKWILAERMTPLRLYFAICTWFSGS